MKLRSKTILLATAFALPLYIGSYIDLSKQGEFRREFTVGLNDPFELKFGWVPKYFISGGKWNYPLLIAYQPLYLIDRSFWHQGSKALSDEYPMDRADWIRIRQL